jgi:CII-binding regulator of phage lambda lysogenization HflD
MKHIVEALKTGRDALAEAIEQHIYDAANGETPEADCRYTQALADMDAALIKAEEAMELLSDNLMAWEGEEESVQEEHAELIERLQAWEA